MKKRYNTNLPGSADPEIINLYIQLEREEREGCSICQSPEWFKPRHFLTHFIFETDGGPQLVVPLGTECGGNGRRFDVEQKQFVGRSHCTCDSCF